MYSLTFILLASISLVAVLHAFFNGLRRRTHSHKANSKRLSETKITVNLADITHSNNQLRNDKRLYHCLQNPEDYPEILPQGRERLIELLDTTVFAALPSPKSTILSLENFSPTSLQSYLATKESSVTSAFSSYLNRRLSGGPRELLPTRAYAEYWLRTSAPVKYVDGAWLGRVHDISTPLRYRPFTRTAWQILSEELGDGDLDKNHVFVYLQLLRSIGADNIGFGDSLQFIDSTTNQNNDARVWAAAIAQLTIGLYSNDFLPEILGFNMAYELITEDTLICIRELKELGLDPQYFNLHVTIDNADSGHAAMAANAVIGLINSARTPEEGERLWRRVQAGVLLAERMPITPTPLTEAEKNVQQIFSNKCFAAKTMHACCAGKLDGVGGMKLEEWLNPDQWEERKEYFLGALAGSRWVARGKPGESALIREMAWGGRMFGAFTINEVSAIKSWIAELRLVEDENSDINNNHIRGSYSKFTDWSPPVMPEVIHPLISSSITPQPALPQLPADLFKTTPPTVLSKYCLPTLLIAAATPFQHVPAAPAKCATSHGMAALRVLRALNGFGENCDGVAGMDEVLAPSHINLVDIANKLHVKLQNQIASDSDPPTVDDDELPSLMHRDWGWLHRASLAPGRNFNFLLGAQLAFVICVLRNEGGLTSAGVNHDLITSLDTLGRRAQNVIASMIASSDREEIRKGFGVVMHEFEKSGSS